MAQGLYGSNGGLNANLYEYPDGATIVTNSSGNVTAATATATLAAVSGKTNYITGFVISGGGATAASVVTATVTGVLGGTMSFTIGVPAGVNAAIVPIQITFPFPIPASAVNTAIAVVLPSLGVGNTNATVVAFGYYR